jgi:hypothetical protein
LRLYPADALTHLEDEMAFRAFGFSLAAASCVVFVAGAVSVASAQNTAINGDTFTAGTTGALARLCAATAQEPAYAAAVHFCHGLLVGTGQASDVLHKRYSKRLNYCLPEPSPTLDQVAASFVAWAAANPQFDSLRAADGLMRFAAIQYPCTARQARR